MTILEVLNKINSASPVERPSKGKIKRIFNVMLEIDISELPFSYRQLSEEYLSAEMEFYKNYKIYLQKDFSFVLSPSLQKYSIWADLFKKGPIYSNYGFYFYENLDKIIDELERDPYTTRAIIYYGNNVNSDKVLVNKESDDFICTIYQAFHIDDKKLWMSQCMRSNDMIYGFLYDTMWAKHCFLEVYNRLEAKNLVDGFGKIRYFIENAHIYERHFSLLEKIVGGNL